MEVGTERIQLPDGRVLDDFLWVKTRDFAIVVAVNEKGEVILERSYKHGPRRVALSLPAGYLEAGETPLDAARRELVEETGLATDDWSALGSFTVDGNYGVSTEHAFLAQRVRRVSEPGSAGHDDLEEIELLTMPLKDAIALLLRGEVAQLSTAAALALAAVRLASARSGVRTSAPRRDGARRPRGARPRSSR
jgi:ADP-ribose pyrophosphatase